MDEETRREALTLARLYEDGNGFGLDDALDMARVLIDYHDRQASYEKRIAELQDAVERTARSGVENATRFAADLAAEKRAGAAAVERIQAALLAGATDGEQRHVVECMTGHLGDDAAPGWLRRYARAYLALSASHAEARALLSDIGERARALLGKGGT